MAKALFLAAFLLYVFTACDMKAMAAAKCDDTYEVTYYKGGNYRYGNDNLFEIKMDAAGDNIMNLRSNNKHLKVYRVTYCDNYQDAEAEIGVWTDKKGKFTFEFDVVNLSFFFIYNFF